jgi:hypothetical protein
MPTLFFEFRMLSGLRPRFNRIMAGGSDLCNIVVIPAKAGIQALNGIARLARDFKTYLWVADPRQVPFLCSCKEKEPKESTPRSARLLLRARGAPNHGAPVRRRGSPPDFHDCSASPSPHRALANSPGAKYAPRAQTRARLTAPGGTAVLGARYGDMKTPALAPLVFSTPKTIRL